MYKILKEKGVAGPSCRPPGTTTTEGALEVLGAGDSALRRLRKQGRLKAVHVCGQNWYSLEELHAAREHVYSICKRCGNNYTGNFCMASGCREARQEQRRLQKNARYRKEVYQSKPRYAKLLIAENLKPKKYVPLKDALTISGMSASSLFSLYYRGVLPADREEKGRNYSLTHLRAIRRLRGT
jgi:hypothetical protein